MANIFVLFEKFFKGLPIIRAIPGFNSLPDKIKTNEKRVSNIVNILQEQVKNA